MDEYLHKELTERIIGAAIAVHGALGPGLLESAYEACLAHELAKRGMKVARQVDVPIIYDGCRVDLGFRSDLIVEDTVVVELKACEKVLPIHEAQLHTHLRLLNKRVGLLINFNVTLLIEGVKRRII